MLCRGIAVVLGHGKHVCLEMDADSCKPQTLSTPQCMHLQPLVIGAGLLATQLSPPTAQRGKRVCLAMV